jgi:hypothetical protein
MENMEREILKNLPVCTTTMERYLAQNSRQYHENKPTLKMECR